MTDNELKQLVQSNARAIQAMIEQRITDKLEHDERMRIAEQQIGELKANVDELREISRSLTGVQQGMAKILMNLDDERPTILSKLNKIDNKLDRIIENQ